MNAGKAVYGILSANSGVTDIVGTNIFPEIAEQETAVPFVVYQLQSVDPDDTHDGPSKLDEVRFEFLCYADSYNAAADLGVAVRAALDRVSGTYNGVHVESVQFNDVDVNIEYDPRRYSQVLTFTFRIKRDDVTIALGTPVTGAVLGDLSDVDVDGVTNGQLIAYNSTSGNWEAANDAGGAEQLNDLSDVIVNLPASGEVLKYDGGEFVNDNIAISNVTGLQAELDATPDSLDDLTDVKIIGTPSEGDALVYQSGFFSLGTAGASTLDELDDVQVPTPSSGAVLQYNGAYWAASALSIPSVPSTYYHQRYSTEAGTLRSGATETVELYYTAQADGDGLSESASSDTPSAGNVIRRKLWYAEKAQADPDTSGDWTQFAEIADDTAYATAKATLLAYLKARTGGTVPISLKMTWEDVAATSYLLDDYSGASAAYSLRLLSSTYSGDAVEIYNGTSYADIGFADGELDTTALAAHCGSNDGFVSTWYDQSGNANDATQTTTANMPKIYDGTTGVVTDGNGKPKIEYATGKFLDTSLAGNSTAWIFCALTAKNDSVLMSEVSTNSEYLFLPRTGSTSSASAGYTVSQYYKNGTAETYATRDDAASAWNDVHGVLTVDVDSSNVSAYRFGFYVASFGFHELQDVIIYHSDQSSNRTNIEDNINTFYSIY